MKDHELLAYFRPSDAGTFTTCNDEKGPFDDYHNGQAIPTDLAEKYKLYEFNISPPLRLKYKMPNPSVTFHGGPVLKYQEYRLLVYTVGIGMESDEEPEDMGIDERVLVLNAAGEITGNYFLGGYLKRSGREEQIVCRNMAFKGQEIVLTLVEEGTVNEPGHLKLELVETRDL